MRRHCSEIGRDYEEIEKTWFGFVVVSDKEEDVKQKFLEWRTNSLSEQSRGTSFEDFLDGNVTGTPEQCVEKIQKYVDLGVTHFIPHFLFERNLKGLRIFRDDVVPAFK